MTHNTFPGQEAASRDQFTAAYNALDGRPQIETPQLRVANTGLFMQRGAEQTRQKVVVATSPGGKYRVMITVQTLFSEQAGRDVQEIELDATSHSGDQRKLVHCRYTVVEDPLGDTSVWAESNRTNDMHFDEGEQAFLHEMGFDRALAEANQPHEAVQDVAYGQYFVDSAEIERLATLPERVMDYSAGA